MLIFCLPLLAFCCHNVLYMKRNVILILFFVLCSCAFAQKEHIVQKGETIESIAQKYGVRVDELETANPIAIKNFYVCTPLVIPEHVPNEEEIRAMEEARARALAIKEQEDRERAERREKSNEFWGAVFGIAAKSLVQSILSPKNTSSSNVHRQSSLGQSKNLSTSSRSVSTGYSTDSDTESSGSAERPKRKCSCKGGHYVCACEKTPTFGNEVYHNCSNCGESHRMGVHSCECRKCGGSGYY